MDCIVWAQKMVAKTSTTAQTGRTLGECEDGLESEDIHRILSVFPLDDNAPECSTEGGEISLTNEEESKAESDNFSEIASCALLLRVLELAVSTIWR